MSNSKQSLVVLCVGHDESVEVGVWVNESVECFLILLGRDGRFIKVDVSLKERLPCYIILSSDLPDDLGHVASRVRMLKEM